MGEAIAVIAEAKGKPGFFTEEVIAFAQALREDPTVPVRVFVPGMGIGVHAHELARLPGVVVTGIEGESLACYNAEAWKTALAPPIAALKPRFICVAHSADGADFAPGLAVRLGTACITAVESFRRTGAAVTFIRSTLKGKLSMEIAPEGGMAVVTVLPGSFAREVPPSGAGKNGRNGAPIPPGREAPSPFTEEKGAKQKTVEILGIPPLALKTRTLGTIPVPDQSADLTAAEVIVAAGRGIGGEENLALLGRLGACFSRSALGASRAVCDAGWLPRSLQVGQTGRRVSPRLYIACGISGAPQHLAGMRGSQCIVAINQDPQAAIFQVADVAAVEELTLFLPLLIEACLKRRGTGGRG